MVGRTILHYMVTAELGAGAMGRVYLARDQRTERRVALKFIAPEAAADPEARARLVREAVAAARLTDPHIVSLFAVEETAGELFLVQEYVEGESLAKRLERGPLGPDEVMRLARALAAALAHAHHHGVLHRDLKPANVLIAVDGTYKLADLGVARIEGAPTLTGADAVVGTAAYMAPERMRGHPGDARSDLFALGAVLYEALTARRAFPGSTDAEVLYGVINSEPRPPEVPTASLLPLAALVMRLLAKEPAERPADAAAVAEALAAMTTRPPVVAPRRPAWAAPVVALLAVALAIAGAWWLRGRVAPSQGAEASVAVLYFDNMADPADRERIGPITGTLLITSLAQVPRLNVLSTQRILDAMRQVGRGHAVFDRTAALDVARHARASRIVTGSVLQVAPTIVMTAEVSDVASGRVLFAERIQGEPGQTVFQVVDALGARLMARLVRGEGTAPLAPLADRTSADLMAQRRYLSGMERLAAGDFAAADSQFAVAVAHDSSFAQAWYQLALIRWWDNEPTAARADILRARTYAARLTPVEREVIEGLSDLVEGNLEPARQRFERLAAEHPDETFVLYGLEEARFHTNDFAGTVATARQLLALAPGFTLAGRHLVDALGASGRVSEALATGRELLRRDPRNDLLHGGLMMLAVRNLDADALVQLQREGERAGIHTASQALALVAIARDSAVDVPALLLGADDRPGVKEQARLGAAYYVALRGGHFREAARIADAAWNQRPRAIGLGDVPWAEGLWSALGLRDVRLALACSDSIVSHAVPTPFGREGYRCILHGMVFVRIGRLTEAERELERAERTLATHGRMGPIAASALRAGIADARGRHEEALALMKDARWFGFPEMSAELVYFRIEMLRHASRQAEALAAIDSLLSCPAIYPDDAVRLHLHRGEVLERLARPAEAAGAYREFLRLWQDADPGRPEVAEARQGLLRVEHAERVGARPLSRE